MIGKVTKGKSARRAQAYDFGPGRRDEHENARYIAGNVPGTWRQVGALMDQHAAQRDLKQPIWRCSLSLPDEDGVLSDAEFAEIATEYVNQMGFGGCPWVAVRHGDDHIHLTVVRVGWDGRTVDDHGDWIKSRPIVRALEARHALVNADERSDRKAPQVSGQERAASQRRGAPEPERLRIRRLARTARLAAAGTGREAFEAELRHLGVDFRANVASNGRMNGYSFSLPTWTDADGAQIWITASKAAKDLSWNRLKAVIEPPLPPDQPPVPPRLRTGPRLREAAEEPGATADPAARLLADLRARHGTEEAGPSLPEMPDPAQRMDRRPHGMLGAAALASRRAVEQHTLTECEAALNAATAAAMRLDGIASGTVPGTQQRALTEHRAQLEAAVVHQGEAAGHQAEAEQQLGAARAARLVADEATTKAGRSRLVLAALGTTKAEQAGMAKAAREFAQRAELAATELLAKQAQALSRAQAAAPGVADPVRELQHLVQELPELERAARQGDIGQAQVTRAESGGTVQAARVAVGQARQAVAAVDAETALRKTLPPAVTAAEERVRAELAQRQRARAAQSRSTTSTRPPPSKRAGPSAAAQQSTPPPRGYDPRDRGRGSGPSR
ncbi:hypothetical protein F7Q99_39410 [Streptomyces kaniharaensis]|uniref:MobA/VirD2-like nuclease domain-containing protein n=1 Tax=Streptomyces kaniharaensis TaxID=212423 RepID=A0A6N7L238_9ACTN|nr:hypothetical protein [Streptomyces kaniharaensis]MQS18086.1 hypothetical protein [Streptomyces kaniharaensis]MQS18099.1 hypothetical protein [Streptomyces kaniharaensis]